MSKQLQSDTLLPTVGTSVQNYEGKFMGKIIEVKRDKNGENIEYLILESDKMFGPGKRYFAIPASSVLLNITAGGNIVLQAKEDDLQFAKGYAADKCPAPNFRVNPLIFELYNYKVP